MSASSFDFDKLDKMHLDDLIDHCKRLNYSELSEVTRLYRVEKEGLLCRTPGVKSYKDYVEEDKIRQPKFDSMNRILQIKQLFEKTVKWDNEIFKLNYIELLNKGGEGQADRQAFRKELESIFRKSRSSFLEFLSSRSLEEVEALKKSYLQVYEFNVDKGKAEIITFCTEIMSALKESVKSVSENKSKPVPSSIEKPETSESLYQSALEMLKKNDDKSKLNAFINFSIAADMGHIKAMTNLATFYNTGISGLIQPNATKAFKLLEHSAGQGHARAKYDLAQMYEYGVGIGINLNKARELYQDIIINKDSSASNLELATKTKLARIDEKIAKSKESIVPSVPAIRR